MNQVAIAPVEITVLALTSRDASLVTASAFRHGAQLCDGMDHVRPDGTITVRAVWYPAMPADLTRIAEFATNIYDGWSGAVLHDRNDAAVTG
jgi:hypothetical protein